MLLDASLIAFISACEVTSLSKITLFFPSPIISPFRTITAPTGTSPASKHSLANSMALSIKSLSIDENISNIDLFL